MEQAMIDVQKIAIDSLYRVSNNCRLCDGSNLVKYLDLGFTPPADQFRSIAELDIPEIHYPLRVNICTDCGLSQLSHVVNPSVLYQFDYPYESSTTKTGKMHWDEFAEKVVQRLQLISGSKVVDVGSNDGTLLQSFKDAGMSVFGVDPAPNIVRIANDRGVETICDFWGVSAARKVVEKIGKVDVIVGTNVFAHVDDLKVFMQSVVETLNDNGVFIFESPHINNLINNLEYDTIYHEHLSYLSLKPLLNFFNKYSMEVFAVEETNIHGGSFRVYIGKQGSRPIDQSVESLLADEVRYKVHNLDALNDFAVRVAENRQKLFSLVSELLVQGKKIAAVSAPAKGMTLLNYCNFSDFHLLYVSEKSKLKIDRITPGGHIPIISDAELMNLKPDYVLLLAWNFSKEIMANLKDYSDNGGKFIIPIPDPKII